MMSNGAKSTWKSNNNDFSSGNNVNFNGDWPLGVGLLKLEDPFFIRGVEGPIY